MTDEQNAYHILINEQSGSIFRLGLEHVEGIIADCGIVIKTLHIMPPDQFFEKLEAIKKSDHPILIGGGDGTLRSSAKILSDVKKPFGILPMGTMNLFARDLGVPVDIADALHAYEHQPLIVDVDMGMINNHPFLCCVGIGTMPEASEFREDNRDQNNAILMPRLTIFMLNQMDRLKHRIMRLSLDGKMRKIKTAALVISNNQYHPEGERNDNNFTRLSLTDGKLGIYSAAPTSLWDRLRLVLNLTFGNWRNDPVIQEWSAETANLNTKRSEELVSIDGETETLHTPLNFWIEREALSVLVPQ